jgi:hypothetical protein
MKNMDVECSCLLMIVLLRSVQISESVESNSFRIRCNGVRPKELLYEKVDNED